MVSSIDRYDEVDVFIGRDVGKGEHHAVALDRAGKGAFDRALPNHETRLRAVLDQLAGHGLILLVVDQPATIGALPVAVAQACGALVGYMLCGFDDDLAGQITQVSNRIRGCSRRSTRCSSGSSGHGWSTPRSSTSYSATPHRPR